MMKRLMAGVLCALLLFGAFTATAENLKYGSEGKQVRLAQARLKQLGYYNGEIDSKYGYSTFQAVRKFQSNNGLKVDGVIGRLTVTVLYGDDVVTSKGIPIVSALAVRIAYGDSGPAVDLIQKRLKTLRHYSGALDGKFGYGTTQAVRSFQRWNKLAVDGIVGPATWKKVFLDSAIPRQDGATPDNPMPDPSKDSYFKIQYGMSGTLIRQIQTRLSHLKYAPGKIDGKFGYATFRAVKSFQTINKLKVDGVVGRKTWDKLFGTSALPKP